MKTKAQKGVLIVDIGSASVGAGFVRFEKVGPVLERVGRKAIGAGSKETREALQPQMLAALDELLKGYEGAYDDVRIVVAAPWESSQIRTIKSKSDKPSSVSMRHIERLIEQYKNEKPPAAGNLDVEAAAVQIRVNNYPTNLVEPVIGTHIAVNLYESEMPGQIGKAIAERVVAHLQATRMTFYTFPLIASASLRAVTDETSFIFVDIGGEVTELGIMHGDALHYLASIPKGYWTLLREMGGSKKDEATVGDARSRLALWVKEELDPEEAASIEEQFGAVLMPWLTELEETLKEASAVVPVPRTLFIMSDTEPAKWIKKGIDMKGTVSLAPTVIVPATVQRIIDVGDGGVFDIFLCLEAIFFHVGDKTVVGEPVPRKR